MCQPPPCLPGSPPPPKKKSSNCSTKAFWNTVPSYALYDTTIISFPIFGAEDFFQVDIERGKKGELIAVRQA